jgi:hypothetical protein
MVGVRWWLYLPAHPLSLTGIFTNLSLGRLGVVGVYVCMKGWEKERRRVHRERGGKEGTKLMHVLACLRVDVFLGLRMLKVCIRRAVKQRR